MCITFQSVDFSAKAERDLPYDIVEKLLQIPWILEVMICVNSIWSSEAVAD
jgi:hypothetical protein